MDKTNIIDFSTFQKQHSLSQDLASDEFAMAIQDLIKRLRDANPIQESPKKD